MSDPRIAPDPARTTQHEPAQVISSVTDLCRTPRGPRDRQLIYGDTVTVLGTRNAWHYVQAVKDGYCGHIRSCDVGTVSRATHKVCAPATHVYERPDFKSPDVRSLTFGSQLRVMDHTGTFAQTNLGFVPLTHIVDVSAQSGDPVAVAELFLGTPYLWGGNSRWGIDCSGLVQAALLACGIRCPGDSDLQQTIGTPAAGPYQRSDLLFWNGHVALVVDPGTLIHANAHAMSVTCEPIVSAIQRISDQGGGSVTAHRRV